MNTAIIISIIICATIVILFVSCLIYDYKVKTADLRSIKHFEKAFGVNPIKCATFYPEHIKTPPEPEFKPADSGEPLDFPNSELNEKYR